MAYKKVKLKHLHSDGFNLAALDYFLCYEEGFNDSNFLLVIRVYLYSGILNRYTRKYWE